jgi:hypothetical protein
MEYGTIEHHSFERHRIVLFALLVMFSMMCVFISYLASSASKPICSDKIIYIPKCNKEEYLYVS